MIKVDETIKNALRKAANASGSVAELARKTGITPSAFTRWFVGQVPVMKPSTWNQLYPYLQSYLPDDYAPPGNPAINNLGSVIKYAKIILADPDLDAEKKVMILQMFLADK